MLTLCQKKMCNPCAITWVWVKGLSSVPTLITSPYCYGHVQTSVTSVWWNSISLFWLKLDNAQSIQLDCEEQNRKGLSVPLHSKVAILSQHSNNRHLVLGEEIPKLSVWLVDYFLGVIQISLLSATIQYPSPKAKSIACRSCTRGFIKLFLTGSWCNSGWMIMPF